MNEEDLLENAVKLKITSIIRPKDSAQNAGISTAVAYTSRLTDFVIAHTDERVVIKAQEADNEINVLTGMKYDEYIAGPTYEENMKSFGKVSFDAPASISIYTDTFENKDAVAACIERYNDAAAEDDRITYTDYMAMMTSSITTIICFTSV